MSEVNNTAQESKRQSIDGFECQAKKHGQN